MHIEHPAVQGESVSFWRWLQYHYGNWKYMRGYRMKLAGDRLMNRALYPDRDDDDGIPF